VSVGEIIETLDNTPVPFSSACSSLVYGRAAAMVTFFSTVVFS
jgi:hypothetical protein